MFSLSFSLFLLLALRADALHTHFEIRFNANGPSTSLTRRTPAPIANTGNAQYVSNMTIGGVTARVLLDTGSSDLWAHFPAQQPSMTNLGKSVSLSYAVGKVQGNVAATTVEFDGYKIDNQGFLYVSDTSSFTADIHAQGYDGLFGLGPNSGSLVRKKLDDDSRGDTLLTHIFETHGLTDNYISFLLDRKGDPSDAFKGQLTISEIIPGFENITSMPKIDVDKVNRLLKADQHWQILTDKDNGIIGPDGQPLKVDSIVPGCPDGQLVAVIDSGFTFSQVPRDISDQIYGRVKGAYYDTSQEFWMIPCGQALNLTFNFGGKSYPVHPLDTVDNNFNRVDSTGQKICLGAFQPITSAFSLLGHYDMILGMSFLRNSYTLLDFGNWIDIDSKEADHPYIQLASVTNADVAHHEFVQMRLAGVDTSGDSKYQLLPPDQMQKSPVSEEEKKKRYQEMILSRWPYILLGCLVLVLGVTGYCIWRCCCRKKRHTGGGESRLGAFFKKGKKSSTDKGGFDAESRKLEEDSPYHPLSTPNNLSMYSLNRNDPHKQPYSNTQNSYNSQSNIPYSNGGDWDRGSGYSLQGPPSPSGLQYPHSAHALNPHAAGSVMSVHRQDGYGYAH